MIALDAPAFDRMPVVVAWPAGGRYELLAPPVHDGAIARAPGFDRLLSCAVDLRIVVREGSRRVFRELVQRERRAAQLLHPSIETAFDSGTLDDGSVFFVTKSRGGRSLAGHLHQSGGLAATEACEIVLQILSILVSAHAAGVAHGALTTSSIALGSRAGCARVVTVRDFGGAWPGEHGDGTTTLERADVRAAGSILFRCLTGRAMSARHGIASVVSKSAAQRELVALAIAAASGEMTTAFELSCRIRALTTECMTSAPESMTRLMLRCA